MRVVFVNRYFHPDISATSQLLADLAFHMARRAEVVVVTSRQKYEEPRGRLPSREVVNGVLVHRIWTTRFGRTSLPGRAIDYLTFYLSAATRLLLTVRRGDVVVALTDPPIVSVVALAVARIKGARLVNWLQDVFPETAEALGVRFPAAARSALRWLRDGSLRAAGTNVVLGEDMAQTVISRGISSHQVEVIHNWSPNPEIKPLAPAENVLRCEWQLQGRFVVGYSGNMGRAHELQVLMKAAERLRSRADIVFLFIGAGNQRPALEAAAREHGLRNVVFKEYQPLHMLPQSLTVPDCHVVSLKRSLEGLVFPSKLYSSLASGRPVLFIGSAKGEICGMMRGDNCFGLCVDPDDEEALVQAVLVLCDDTDQRQRMGENGRRFFERRFDPSIALGTWTALLERIGERAVVPSGPP